MSWNPPDLGPSIILSFGIAILAGLLLLTLQWGWNTLGKRRRRRAAVEALSKFFQEWESEICATAHDEDWQFIRHEQMIRRINDHLALIRPDLSDRQWTDITQLIRNHEELIDNRRWILPMATLTNDPVPPRFVLLPGEYREFFEQAIKIKWLKPSKAKSGKQVDSQ